MKRVISKIGLRPINNVVSILLSVKLFEILDFSLRINVFTKIRESQLLQEKFLQPILSIKLCNSDLKI